MPLEGGAGRSFRFSTDDLPEVARVEAVRELHERTALPGKIEPLEPLPNCLIRVDITKHALPGLGVMSGTLAGIRQAARSSAKAFVCRTVEPPRLRLCRTDAPAKTANSRSNNSPYRESTLATRGRS